MAIAFIEITAENYIDKINNTESYMFWPLLCVTVWSTQNHKTGTTFNSRKKTSIWKKHTHSKEKITPSRYDIKNQEEIHIELATTIVSNHS
jgi:hypothetical protein